MELQPNWEFVADTVMGGVSTGDVQRGVHHGRDAARLTGRVSLENNGGFVQMAFDLPGAEMDASGWTGIEVTTFGNGERYDMRLRTADLARPWQSYRAGFTAPPEWQTTRLPFSAFEPNKTDQPFDPARLRRVGILAVGRAFDADIAVAQIGFYR